MSIQGISLRTIPSFPADAYATLRDELSVTTAEQFLDLSIRYPKAVMDALKADQKQLEHLVEIARSVLTSEDISDIQKDLDPIFRTGHDAPPSGKSTFYEEGRYGSETKSDQT